MYRQSVRVGDMSSGHDCFPPRPAIEGSDCVFINSRQAVRVGDMWAIHCCPDMGCHIGISIEGSNCVFINSRQAVRVGDFIDCGGIAMEGSNNVFIG